MDIAKIVTGDIAILKFDMRHWGPPSRAPSFLAFKVYVPGGFYNMLDFSVASWVAILVLWIAVLVAI